MANTGTVPAVAAVSVLLAPAAEELIYRGFLLPSLTGFMPYPLAVWLPSTSDMYVCMVLPQCCRIGTTICSDLGCTQTCSDMLESLLEHANAP